jgi:hypothetical protein
VASITSVQNAGVTSFDITDSKQQAPGDVADLLSRVESLQARTNSTVRSLAFVRTEHRALLETGFVAGLFFMCTDHVKSSFTVMRYGSKYTHDFILRRPFAMPPRAPMSEPWRLTSPYETRH